VCALLEELVVTKHWPVYSPFAKEHFGKGLAEGREEGRKEGERDKILLTLRLRGLEVTDSQRERIVACTDLDRLREWSQRALTAVATSELFG
jgi:predicted transposase YdaD